MIVAKGGTLHLNLQPRRILQNRVAKSRTLGLAHALFLRHQSLLWVSANRRDFHNVNARALVDVQMPTAGHPNGNQQKQHKLHLSLLGSNSPAGAAPEITRGGMGGAIPRTAPAS